MHTGDEMSSIFPKDEMSWDPNFFHFNLLSQFTCLEVALQLVLHPDMLLFMMFRPGLLSLSLMYDR